jgi:hypothetical protein
MHSFCMMKSQIIQKFQSFEILKERAAKQIIHFLNYLTKNIMFNGSKCLALGVGHMCKK